MRASPCCCCCCCLPSPIMLPPLTSTPSALSSGAPPFNFTKAHRRGSSPHLRRSSLRRRGRLRRSPCKKARTPGRSDWKTPTRRWAPTTRKKTTSQTKDCSQRLMAARNSWLAVDRRMGRRCEATSPRTKRRKIGPIPLLPKLTT